MYVTNNLLYSRYTGKSRALYCETTGLTLSFVNSSSLVALRHAAVNLGVTINADFSDLRNKLKQFVEGK